MTVHWNPADPTTIQEQGFLDRALPAAAAAGIRIIFAVYPSDRYAFSGVARGARGAVRRLPPDACAALPTGHRLHRRKRAERVVLLAAAVRSREEAGVGRGLPPHDDCRLRRAEGGRSEDSRDRGRPVERGQRQDVDIACALHRGARRRVPGERALHAVHGRDGVPRLSAQQHASALEALRWPNIGPLRPRKDQAGRLGRVRRHAAADVRRKASRSGPGDLSGSSWASSAGRWRSARGSPRDTRTRRTCRRSPRPSRRSYYARADPDVRVRPCGDGRDDLPPRRRGRPRPVPVRAAADRRSKRPSYGAVRQGDRRRVGVRESAALEARARRRRREGDLRARDHPAAESTLFGISATAAEDAVAKAGIFRVADALRDAGSRGRSTDRSPLVGGATPVAESGEDVKAGLHAAHRVPRPPGARALRLRRPSDGGDESRPHRRRSSAAPSRSLALDTNTCSLVPWRTHVR